MSASFAQSALLVNFYDSDRHDRFENSSSFIGSAYEWNGIGLQSNGRWATLISPSFVISAQHNSPLDSTTIRFYETNNSGGAFVEKSIVDSQRIGTTDLRVLQLDSAIDTGTYQVNPVLDSTLAGAVGLDLFVVGHTSAADQTTRIRVGTNTIDSVIADFNDPRLQGGLSTTDVVLYDYDIDEGRDEALVQGGDSGGPSFTVVDGELALVGIHWFQYLDDMETSGSGDSFVAGYLSEINGYLATEGESLRTVSAVPEPSAPVILTVLGLVGFGWRRRPNSSTNGLCE